MTGKRVGHFLVGERLGVGGMGVVYAGEDLRLRRPVALKFLTVEKVSDEKRRERFLREAMAASALDHPNICTIYTVDETPEGQLYMAMAYYEGETLHDRLARGPLREEEALDIALQAARGLDRAHERGITHRDIKPANLILTRDGTLKILDFGLAQIAGESNLTLEGHAVGTLRYMSPEQVSGGAVDHRTDIWALGVVLYEMLTGVPLFRKSELPAFLHAVLTQEPEPVRNLRPEVSANTEAIVAKAIRKNPADRYQRAGEMAADISAVQAGSQVAIALPRISSGSGPHFTAETIAVLPFESLSGDKENEYFGDGLAEELINALSRVEGLRVAARTSSFEFRGKAQNVQKVAEALSVAHVLEGSVRTAGPRVRIITRLTNARDGFLIWSEKYDRDYSDVFAVQEEIATTIVETLRLKLIKTDSKPLVRKYTDNVRAYHLYLQGRFHWNRKTPGSLQKAHGYFQAALEEDPSYALAYAGIAEYFCLLAAFAVMPPRAAWEESRRAALKALELDSELADAHRSFAVTLAFYEWEWESARFEFDRALQAQPQSVDTLCQITYLNLATNRLDEALASIRKARRLDPLSVAVMSIEAMVLAYTGRLDEALELCRKGLEIDPAFLELHYVQGLTLGLLGREAEAVAAFEKAAESGRRIPLILGWLGASYTQAGRREDALGVLNELRAAAEAGGNVSLPLAVLYTALGDRDEAFRWLNAAADSRELIACYFQSMPTFAPLKDDPRFGQLRHKMHLDRSGSEMTVTMVRPLQRGE
jgi:serine/threonine-protein kinase